jgi:hypothetical protein
METTHEDQNVKPAKGKRVADFPFVNACTYPVVIDADGNFVYDKEKIDAKLFERIQYAPADISKDVSSAKFVHQAILLLYSLSLGKRDFSVNTVAGKTSVAFYKAVDFASFSPELKGILAYFRTKILS